MAKTKKQGENSACSALFEHAYYSSGYGKQDQTCPGRVIICGFGIVLNCNLLT